MRKILVVLTLASALGVPVSAALAGDDLHGFQPAEQAPAINLAQGTDVVVTGPDQKIDYRGDNMDTRR